MTTTDHADLRQAVATRVKRVERMLTLIHAEAAPSERTVHSLRVATRRARSALAVVEPLLNKPTLREAKRALKRARRAAADARACDVDRARFAAMLEAQGEPAAGAADPRRAIAYAVSRVSGERCAAFERLRRAAASGRIERIKRVRKRISSQLRARRESPASDCARLADAIAEAVDAARRAGAGVRDAPSLDAIHATRIALKRRRYTVEFTGQALDCAQRVRPLVKALAAIQDELGLVNDAGERAARVQEWLDADGEAPAPLPSSLRSDCLALHAQLERERDDALGETLAAWPAIATDRIGAALRQAAALADALTRGDAPRLSRAPDEPAREIA